VTESRDRRLAHTVLDTVSGYSYPVLRHADGSGGVLVLRTRKAMPGSATGPLTDVTWWCMVARSG
jgi:hypothetical protein